MYEYKKGFTLIEVLLVVVLMIAMFSMSLALLGSFSSTSQKYIEKDFDEVKNVLGQIKYLEMMGEKNIGVECDSQKIKLLVNHEVIDEKQLKTLTCAGDMKLSNASSTFQIKINQYGQVIFQRI